jgi:type VII secretion effector (TIGR04197 family)
MGNRIVIDESEIYSQSSQLNNAASAMQSKSLASTDEESTIPGNEECKNAYQESQQALAKLVETLNAEAAKLQAVGNDFKNVDSEMATLIKLATE